MELTKFTHSCVRLDDGDRSLVIDPGSFSEIEAAVDGVSAILVTHEHMDHLEPQKVRAALARDSRLRIYGPSSITSDLADLGEQAVTVEPGEQFEAAGFTVQAVGGRHALIHPVLPVVANVGYLVDGVYHPGDSFFVPVQEVSTLLLPTNAPWSKAAEVIDFAIAVGAPRAHQIHDGLIKDSYAGLVEGHLDRIAGPHGVEFQHLATLESVAV